MEKRRIDPPRGGVAQVNRRGVERLLPEGRSAVSGPKKRKNTKKEKQAKKTTNHVSRCRCLLGKEKRVWAEKKAGGDRSTPCEKNPRPHRGKGTTKKLDSRGNGKKKTVFKHVQRGTRLMEKKRGNRASLGKKNAGRRGPGGLTHCILKRATTC